eukprot:TRINITY_DN474_c0_g1_i2.p1 TRINITY_DN474_c0_g1~~TRINITY_DN474_c0_g1_i2.p1  ORF type:complete len:269 (-),score=37.24 TRINITY_DN474_c0_g1_i2:201-1007(-)
MCFGQSGGAFVLGGYDDFYQTSPFQYTPITHELYYMVSLQSIGVDGTQISLSSNVTTIIDSGTTGCIVPPDTFQQLKTNLLSLCNNPNPPSLLCASVNLFNIDQGQSITFTDDELNQLPPIFFNFAGSSGNESIVVSVAVPPQVYVMRQPDGPVWAGSFGIFPMEGMGVDFILGDTFMAAFNTIFDVENKRIGFAPVQNCGSDLQLNGPSQLLLWFALGGGFLILFCFLLCAILICMCVRKPRHTYSPIPEQVGPPRYEDVSKEPINA